MRSAGVHRDTRIGTEDWLRVADRKVLKKCSCSVDQRPCVALPQVTACAAARMPPQEDESEAEMLALQQDVRGPQQGPNPNPDTSAVAPEADEAAAEQAAGEVGCSTEQAPSEPTGGAPAQQDQAVQVRLSAR